MKHLATIRTYARSRSLYREFGYCIGWPLAIACIVAQLELVEIYSPLPSAFTEIAPALTVAGYLAARAVLVGWVLLFTFAGLVLVVTWGVRPRAISIVAALVAVSHGLRDGTETFLLLIELSPFALVVIFLCWAQKGGAEVEHWFYLTAPAGALALCAVGFGFLWVLRFPLHRFGAEFPWIAAALLILLSIAVLTPALRRAPGRIPQLVMLGAGLAFVTSHGSFLFFEQNYEIVPYRTTREARLEPSHIVLVVIDTLRADALSYRSTEAPDTPRIDSLAAESIVFENAIAPSPWTVPSMDSVMTGLAPLQDALGLHYSHPRMPTLAQYLAETGYFSRAIVGNHLLFRPHNVAEGFHQIETYANTPIGDSPRVLGLLNLFPLRFAHGGSTSYITDRAIDWIAGSADRPSFLWLHYFDPHDPYLPPVTDLPEGASVPIDERVFDERSSDPVLAKKLYDAEVRFVDYELGRFLDALKDAGLYDDALIVVTSDHGEEFWEHGGNMHGSSLYQELLHVPLLIRLPGGAVNKRVTAYVPIQALLPTVLDLARVKSPPRLGWAPSLMPLLKQDAFDQYSTPIVSGATLYGEAQWSIVLDRMKYIYRSRSHLEELYDLDADPGEQFSILAEHPEIAAIARRSLQEHHVFAASLVEKDGAISEGLSRETEDRMRSLGYIR